MESLYIGLGFGSVLFLGFLGFALCLHGIPSIITINHNKYYNSEKEEDNLKLSYHPWIAR